MSLVLERGCLIPLQWKVNYAYLNVLPSKSSYILMNKIYYLDPELRVYSLVEFNIVILGQNINNILINLKHLNICFEQNYMWHSLAC